MLVAAILGLTGQAAAAVEVEAIAGVYKERFENGTVSNERYASENILELVRVSATVVYFKTHLEFFNGHTCGLYGTAELQGDVLTFTDQPSTDDPPLPTCRLRLRVLPASLQFEDPAGSCSQYCGARGAFDNIEFARSARRPIRYLDRLLRSEDYRRAIDRRDAKGSKTPVAP